MKSAGCNLLIKKEEAKLAESAADIAAALRWVGFQSVTVAEDLTREKLIEALRDFARKAEEAAKAIGKKAEVEAELFGRDSEEAIATTDFLARIYEIQDDWPSALRVRRKTLEARIASLGEAHWKAVDARLPAGMDAARPSTRCGVSSCSWHWSRLQRAGGSSIASTTCV